MRRVPVFVNASECLSVTSLSSCAGVHLLKIDLFVLYLEIAKCSPYSSDAGIIA